MKVGYVIGPFRAPTHWEIAGNVRIAEEVGLQLAHMGVMPLIPHANTATLHGTLTDEFWLRGTQELMRRADFAITVGAAGCPWQHSEGSRAEEMAMLGWGKLVFHDFDILRRWLSEHPE